MITVSTLKANERRYHHGDLRTALITEGLRAVEANGAEALSLREIARAAGVSATAVYRHFPDKRALLAALASEGVRRLGQAQEEAAATASSPNDAFVASGKAYVRFALDNPGLFRLTFTHPEVVPDEPADDAAARMLHDHARRLADGDEGAARTIALQAWALVHGLAMLMLDRRVPQDDALIGNAITAAAFGPTRC